LLIKIGVLKRRPLVEVNIASKSNRGAKAARRDHIFLRIIVIIFATVL